MFKISIVPVRLLLLLLWIFGGSVSFAQDKQGENTVNDVMRSNDKIYVVMAVCVTILLGLIFYTIRIDRKISKIEDLKKS